MAAEPFPYTGLSPAEVAASRTAHGTNTLVQRGRGGFWQALRTAVTEPMFLLLLSAAVIYFILGELREALFMLGAIMLISAISLYQDHRSRRALEALGRFAQPKARAIRGASVVELPADELVVGDLVVVNEGELVPADGLVVQANDFAVNESILTGEAFSVTKEAGTGRTAQVFGGTQAVGGLAVVRLTAVGGATEIGRIGRSLAVQEGGRSPLEQQIQRFVRRMAVVGVLFFLLVWGL
ncbi:MAG: cation-transporting P-type ATPase, partial [Flavobacteriales bacterium]